MISHNKPYAQQARFQRGVGIIEILIAVIIISVGFLASAQMQVQGMRFNQNAYFRSQASMMVKDMTDRMRVNRVAVTGGSYSGKTTSATHTYPSCIASNTPCTPAQLAERDLTDWSANLHAPANTSNFTALLPSSTDHTAAGSVTEDAGVYTIAVQWSERVDGVESLQQLSVEFMP